ncbi:MAG: cytoplasmic protein [Deltaproteobacteria bacterium]|nr:cytoplasmic protein [Deltaproteobacteria bacterium]
MHSHSHLFVEKYNGLVGFGIDREIDENTIIYFLQKFSDDRLMEKLVKRLTDDELEEIFNMITRFMRKYLSEPEYHELFLKDNHP